MATMTAVHDPVLSRVKLDSTGWGGSDLSVRYYVRPSGATTWDTVRGAQAVPVASGTAITVFDYEFPWSGSVPGTVDYAVYSAATNTWVYALGTVVDISAECWLKVPGYPYLNQKVNPTGIGDLERAGRSDLAPVIAQSPLVGSGDVMSGYTTSIEVPTSTWDEYMALDLLLKVGGVLMLHADEADLGLPSMYAMVTRSSGRRTGKHNSSKRRTEIQLVQVARPHYAYAGAVGTYQSVLNQHATYQDVLNTYATYLDLAQIVGSPADVVVG